LSFYPRFDKHRWLRSDGKPEFSSKLYRIEGDLERLAKRPALTIPHSSPVKEALERMNTHKVRSLVATSGDKYQGLLLAENILDYLGGGDSYNIVINRYEGNFFSCLEEPVKSLISPSMPSALISSKLSEVVEIMVREGASIVPILNKDGTVYGVISEHDIVELLIEKRTGVTAGEISSQIISVNTFDPILEAMRKMASLGVRQIFVRNEAEQIVGTIDIKRLIAYFGSSEVYRWVKKGYVTEANSASVGTLASYNLVRIPASMDVGEAARIMFDSGSSSALVLQDSEEVGMITEHDIFYALALPLK